MALMGAACALLLVLTTLIHYEALRGLSVALPRLRLPSRTKLIVVIISSFAAHIAEVALYAVAIYALARWFAVGTLGSMPVPRWRCRCTSRQRRIAHSGTATSCRTRLVGVLCLRGDDALLECRTRAERVLIFRL
jgi:formate-dependent nitrite reductase membrane component NrfD